MESLKVGFSSLKQTNMKAVICKNQVLISLVSGFFNEMSLVRAWRT